MPYHLNDTIAAIASPPGGAARGIVRISGPAAVSAARALFRPDELSDLGTVTPRASAGHVRLESLACELPATLLVWPTERSYTREPAAELHTLGSPPLLAAILAQLGRQGVRLAEPGEFTLRAFLAGRIDLTQAEAVLGIIDARGQGELEAALGQMAGGLARPIAELREQLLDLLAQLEAGLDFVEDDIQFIAAEQVERLLAAAAAEVARLTAQLAGRRREDSAVRAVLVGPPNAGKSSLFNALAQAGALVSPQPGTTRDYLVARLDLEGLACDLVDTAGVEAASDDVVARQAQAQTAAQADAAQIRLLCFDVSQPCSPWHRADWPPSTRAAN